MAECNFIEDRPPCKSGGDVLEPLELISAALGGFVAGIGTLTTVLGYLDVLKYEGGELIISIKELIPQLDQIPDLTIGGGFAAGIASAVLAGLATIFTISVFADNRCSLPGKSLYYESKGLSECIAGVVYEIVEGFSDWVEEIFPFTAMHDRIDLVVKSKFWATVEDSAEKVYCTGEYPYRSVIMRCYYYDRRVCNAVKGALLGAGVSFLPAVVVGAAIAAALCTSGILCLLGIVLAALAAIIIVLAGAATGGQIGKGNEISDDSPLAEDTEGKSEEISVGDYLTVRGNMVPRSFDGNANVIWWVSHTNLHGKAGADLRRPFSYCEIDGEFVDSCELPTGPY